MVFFLSVIAIFVAVSIYFFFKAESLHRSLISVRRESNNIKKESKSIADNFALIAKRNEEFAQKRLFDSNKDSELHQHLVPLITNYATIFIAATKGKNQLHNVVKKCCDTYDPQSFHLFKAYIAKQDPQIKRMWSSNNLSGFMNLIEALLIDLADQKLTKL